MNLCELTVVSLISITAISAQVCSPPGQLCTRTTDCCKGCCEAHTCVERSFPCSSDLIQQPGQSSCYGYYCPQGQICYLRDVCPPENPCAPLPQCRRVDMINNYSDYPYRNSFPQRAAGHLLYYFSVTTLILSFMTCLFL